MSEYVQPKSLSFFVSFDETAQQLNDADRLKYYDAIFNLAFRNVRPSFEAGTALALIWPNTEPVVLKSVKRSVDGIKSGGRPKKVAKKQATKATPKASATASESDDEAAGKVPYKQPSKATPKSDISYPIPIQSQSNPNPLLEGSEKGGSFETDNAEENGATLTAKLDPSEVMAVRTQSNRLSSIGYDTGDAKKHLTDICLDEGRDAMHDKADELVRLWEGGTIVDLETGVRYPKDERQQYAAQDLSF